MVIDGLVVGTLIGLIDVHLAISAIPTILSGLPMSLFLLVTCFILANILGFILVLVRQSRWAILRWLARFYISFFRGVPMLVILFITYFGFNMDAIPAAILSFTIAPAAFISEYYRSAFLGVDIGQYEAARSLGMNRYVVLRYVILPQALRIVLPSLGNVMVDMFKGTSLAAMITVSEMFMDAKIVAGANQDYMSIYITLAVIYWLLCCVLSWGQSWLEKRLDFVAKAEESRNA